MSFESDLPELSNETKEIIEKIGELIIDCESILFVSGSGMSVDSGIGTFRGNTADIWSPLLEEPKFDYIDICNPICLPHHGYHIAKRWSELNHIKFSFSFTSNIDNQWRKSGWNELSLLEYHGSINNMQCIQNCSDSIWLTNNFLKLHIDSKTNCIIDSLPLCRYCHQLARPNVLMFNDRYFACERFNEQIDHYEQFKLDLLETKSKLLIIELGAGTTIPLLRNESEKMFKNKKWFAHLIRINPLIESSTINYNYKNKYLLELSMNALNAMNLIDQTLNKILK